MLINAMKLGCNHPMGPIELTDFVGIDTMLATMTGLYNGFHDSKYRPCPLLETMVKSGMLGKKTGQGFYKYDEKGNKIGSNLKNKKDKIADSINTVSKAVLARERTAKTEQQEDIKMKEVVVVRE